MKKLAFAIALSAAMATPAFAQSPAGNSYIAVDVGTATYSGVSVAAGTYPNPGAVTVAYGHKVSDVMGFELGGTMFGDSSLSGSGITGTISASTLFGKVVGNLALANNFSLTGNVGVGFNHQQLAVTSMSALSSSATGLIFGAGAKYKINDRFSLYAQYENYGSFGTFGATNGNMTASTLAFGGTIGF